jgi:hypothetical protein
MSKQKYVSSVDLALAHLGMGQREEAMELLDQAVAERSPRVAFLGVEPHFDPLWADTRFQRLISRIGIPSRSSGALTSRDKGEVLRSSQLGETETNIQTPASAPPSDVSVRPHKVTAQAAAVIS